MPDPIKIVVRGATVLPYTQLVPFQGDLKHLIDERYNQLKDSILQYGFSFVFHVWQHANKNYIIDGHQRLRTIQRMVEQEGYTCPSLPVAIIQAKDFKEAKLKVLAGASQFGEVTEKGLFAFMRENDIPFDEISKGFHFPEIDFGDFKTEFFPELQSDYSKENEIPQAPVEAKSRVGELYILGDHRLLCGDSTDEKQVERLMDGNFGDLLLTDPPYGVSYMEKNAAVNGGVVKNSIGKEIKNDCGCVEEMGSLWGSLFSMADFFTDEASYYVFSPQGGELMMMMMMQSIHQSKWQLKHSLIWQKQNFVFGRCDYHYQHEPVLYGWKKKGTHKWYADRSQSSLLQFDKPHKSDLHPTTKPVDILRYLIGNSSKPGDKIVDLFAGSGSTLIGSEETKRQCFAMEIDPTYIDVILDRYVKFTGKDPIREDGTPWSVIKSQSP